MFVCAGRDGGATSDECGAEKPRIPKNTRDRTNLQRLNYARNVRVFQRASAQIQDTCRLGRGNRHRCERGWSCQGRVAVCPIAVHARPPATRRASRNILDQHSPVQPAVLSVRRLFSHTIALTVTAAMAAPHIDQAASIAVGARFPDCDFQLVSASAPAADGTCGLPKFTAVKSQVPPSDLMALGCHGSGCHWQITGRCRGTTGSEYESLSSPQLSHTQLEHSHVLISLAILTRSSSPARRWYFWPCPAPLRPRALRSTCPAFWSRAMHSRPRACKKCFASL